ncbi:hypothetical protein SAMN05444483_10414 [Salegentibacter echinorum]|uniref:Uncharacterized protein n=1 Tax=Salegentibacter echinorum TaxID=1073325 RepID=A0A1M5G6B2_SALEC|nr:hypothetical protein [Salegentibacter echinorum]SHF99194.1 hypothetical protein SAMN05444483_10414 [Salegentibacter echinorum]
MKFDPNKKLLPTYFKTIAYAIAGLSVVLGVLSYVEQVNLNKDIFIPLAKYLFLLALIFFSFSKEKIERKRYIEIRLKNLVSGILFITLFFLFDAAMELPRSIENRENKTGFELLMLFHIYYLIMFQRDKSKMLKTQKTKVMNESH